MRRAFWGGAGIGFLAGGYGLLWGAGRLYGTVEHRPAAVRAQAIADEVAS